MRKLVLLLILVLAASLLAAAADTTALRPPKGARVAIVVFEDLQCPDCSRAWPLLQEAARTYKIPIVHYDFPLPMHNWSFQAAILARYFDSISPKVGDEFRTQIFAHQIEITPDNVRQFGENFAKEHNLKLPFAVDPKGELEKRIKQDFNLGQRTGVQHTPTIYIVSNTQRGTPFVEVVDRSQLYALIDDMLKQAGPAENASDKPARRMKSGPPKS
ncbi:MAG: DsbA family protein [Acidobacteriia bacterium]|nr:DsbA family protein [Terriglobia bacterium]